VELCSLMFRGPLMDRFASQAFRGNEQDIAASSFPRSQDSSIDTRQFSIRCGLHTICTERKHFDEQMVIVCSKVYHVARIQNLSLRYNRCKNTTMHSSPHHQPFPHHRYRLKI